MTSFILRMSDIDRCPKRSFAASHYSVDGSCACDHPELAVRLAQAEEAIDAHTAALAPLRAEAAQLRSLLGLRPRR